MTEQDRRELTVKINEILKKLHVAVPERFLADKNQMFLYLRHVNHLIQDVRNMVDYEENPEKVTIEMTKKKGEVNGADAKPVGEIK